MKKIIIASVIFLFCSVATAQVYQQGTFKVSSLRITNDYTYVRFSPALDACEGGTQYRMHAKVSNENDMLVSSLLAAYTAEKTIQYIFASGEGTKCSGSHILTLDTIEFTPR